MSLAILADEGVDLQIVERLRAAGYPVRYIAEIAPGLSDQAILTTAAADNLLLLTADKDFGDLVFQQGRTSAGVVLIRLAGLSQAAKAEQVLDAVQRHDTELQGRFSVISPGALRIRTEI